MRRPSAAAVFSGAFVGLFVALPLAVLLAETVFPDGRLDLSPWREILASGTDRRQWFVSLGLGLLSASIAVPLGVGYAFVVCRTDLPGARLFVPAAAFPLVVPPILTAMAYADLFDARGFLACSFLLALAYVPFVALLALAALRQADGAAYEAARLARGRAAAERMLLRMALPEIAVGALLVFVFAVSDHGVPEFLTVKGKTWHTYAEAVFSRWTRRAVGGDAASAASPIVAAVPLVLLVVLALAGAVALRRRSASLGRTPLPQRPLGRWRGAALAVPLAYLILALGVPVWRMADWAAGGTDRTQPASWARFAASVRRALLEAGGDLAYTVLVAACAALLLLCVGWPLARRAAAGRGALEVLVLVPLAVPAILLGIAYVRTFNRPLLAGFYDSPAAFVCVLAARFLPFVVLPGAAALRGFPLAMREAARLQPRPRLVRFARIELPLLGDSIFAALCFGYVLSLRELDLAVVLPQGNATVVRRLANIVHFGGEDVGGALALLLLLVAALPAVLYSIATGRRLAGLEG